MRIIVCSGGFDPIHSGHIRLLNAAKAEGDYLVVGINSDAWLERKKEKYFMPFNERRIIVENLTAVDEVMAFDDSDNTACDLLHKVIEHFKQGELKNFDGKGIQIVFANGGDRTSENIPEMDVEGVEFIFGVGGEDKANSSSWILKEHQYPKEDRIWGNFSNLFQDANVKVKELVIEPGKGISYQRHFKRNELWYVSKGECFLKFAEEDPKEFEIAELKAGCDPIIILSGDWHQAYNTSTEPCHIIEIQYGEETEEEDIERLEMYNEQ